MLRSVDLVAAHGEHVDAHPFRINPVFAERLDSFLFLEKHVSVQGHTSACSYKNKKESSYIGKKQAESHEIVGIYLSGRHEEVYL